jgi:acetolactate synthase-1/2/3 large subunit
MAQSPLIILGGAAATILKGRGALQDIEQIRLLKTITKWATTIKQDCDIVPAIEEALDVARSGIPGPVFIECPIDLLYDESLVRKWYESYTSGSENRNDKTLRRYLRTHVDNLFACSKNNIPSYEPKFKRPFKIEESEIYQTISFLKDSLKPVLVIGSQAMLRINDVNKLATAVNRLNIPVYLTGMARGLLGNKNALNYRHKRSDALREADFVILAGMSMDFRLNYGRSINSNAKLVLINRSKKELKRNRIPTLGIQADPSQFLINLSNKVEYKKDLWNKWVEVLNQREAKREKKIQSFSKLKTDYINPLFLCQQINKKLDANSIIIGDGGDFVATASYIVKPKGSLSWLDPGPFGTLGVGAGFALAAKLVRSEAEIWLLYGDGAAGYSIIEFDSFVRHKIPIIAVVGNDAGWTQIARDQIEYLKDDVGTVLSYTNYHVAAEGYGAKGLLLKNEEEISEILDKAKYYAKEGHPVILNTLIGKTDFRKGSISM